MQHSRQDHLLRNRHGRFDCLLKVGRFLVQEVVIEQVADLTKQLVDIP